MCGGYNSIPITLVGRGLPSSSLLIVVAVDSLVPAVYQVSYDLVSRQWKESRAGLGGRYISKAVVG